MPTGFPKKGINSGWFKKGIKPKHYAKISKNCIKCGSVFLVSPSAASQLHCSVSCSKRGIPRSDEFKKMVSAFMTGRRHTKEARVKISLAMTGPKNWNWNPDRESVKYDRRNDPAYKQWRKSVYIRDSFKCKISNNDCDGRIEAHHILKWSEFVELRYEIKNGITLCRFHHPRKKVDEQNLIQVFQELVK